MWTAVQCGKASFCVRNIILNHILIDIFVQIVVLPSRVPSGLHHENSACLAPCLASRLTSRHAQEAASRHRRRGARGVGGGVASHREPEAPAQVAPLVAPADAVVHDVSRPQGGRGRRASRDDRYFDGVLAFFLFKDVSVYSVSFRVYFKVYAPFHISQESQQNVRPI